MKLIAEYLERAHQFELLSAHETDPKLKANFAQQALAYHRLAEKRASEAELPFAKGINKAKAVTVLFPCDPGPTPMVHWAACCSA